MATVSRVINGQGRVSHEREKLVRQAMSELGYEPPPLNRRQGRRSLRRSRTLRTGIVTVVQLDDVYNYTPGIFASFLRGIEQAASSYGMVVTIVHACDSTNLSPIIEQQQADGYVLMGAHTPPGLMEKLRGKPIIWSGSHHGHTGDVVLAGNYEIGRLAANYLLSRGHQHLAFLSAMDWYPAYPARAEAFAFTAQRKGATAHVITNRLPDEGMDGMREMGMLRCAMEPLVARLLDLSPRVAGLFLPNDLMTAVAYPLLQQRGVRPGRDIDIVSCNNDATYLVGLNPRPATIDIASELHGRRSVEQLLCRIKQPDDARPVEVAIKPVLIPPESVDS
ncbi:MAG: LacI family DNA-binding transcriptional regulator [Phycisphaeraceae bacterium]|nr:LacI family DNA-binding transcriptional regulator [Phycisphaeraceae bacterium]